MLSNVCQAQTAGPVTHVQGLATLPFECIWQAYRASRQQIHLFIQLCRCQIVKHHCWFETRVTDIPQETTALLFKLLNSNSFWLSLLGLRQGKTQRQSRAQAAPRICSISRSLRPHNVGATHLVTTDDLWANPAPPEGYFITQEL